MFCPFNVFILITFVHLEVKKYSHKLNLLICSCCSLLVNYRGMIRPLIFSLFYFICSSRSLFVFLRMIDLNNFFEYSKVGLTI